MKIKLSAITLIVSTVLVLVSSCSNNDNGILSPSNPDNDILTPSKLFNRFEALDRENIGNSSDISLIYSVDSDIDISTIDELRLIVSSSTLTLEEAIQLPSSKYDVLPSAENLQINLAENISDIEGDLIEEGQSYNVYVLGVYNDNDITSILSEPAPITLKNEIVVTTPVLTGSFSAMEDIAIGSDGSLYVCGGKISENNLYKVTPEGQSSILNNTMNWSVGITLDNDGNIYTSNFKSTNIKKITPSGQATNFASNSALIGGGGLTIDNNGNIYNTFMASSSLFHITEGSVKRYPKSLPLTGPIGITYDKERDNIYIASFSTGQIYRLSSDSSFTLIANTPASIGHISYANNHLYITGWFENKVFQLSLGGQITATIGNGAGLTEDGPSSESAFFQPNGIEATPDGKYVYVTQGNGQLRKIIMPR